MGGAHRSLRSGCSLPSCSPKETRMPSDFLLESFLALVSKEIDDDLRSGTGAAAAPLPTDAGGCAAGGGIATASFHGGER